MTRRVKVMRDSLGFERDMEKEAEEAGKDWDLRNHSIFMSRCNRQESDKPLKSHYDKTPKSFNIPNVTRGKLDLSRESGLSDSPVDKSIKFKRFKDREGNTGKKD